jgi:hypothetical protein
VLSVNERGSDGDKVSLVDGATVDIGSTLLIAVDKAALRRVAVERRPSSRSQELVGRFTAATERLQRLNRLATPLQKATHTYGNSPTDANLVGLRQATGAVAAAVVELLESLQKQASEGDAIAQQLWATMDTKLEQRLDDSERLAVVADAAREEMALVRAELEATLHSKNVYIQMGAFLVTDDGAYARHLDGFDDVAPVERYELDRWKLALSDEENQKLAAAAQAATVLNAGGLPDLLKSAGPKLVEDLFKRTDEKLRILADEAQAATRAGTPLADELKSEVLALGEDSKAFRSLLEALLSKYRTASPQPASELLSGSNADLNNLAYRGRKLIERVKAIEEKLKKLAAGAAAAAVKLTGACGDVLRALTDDLVGNLSAVAGLANVAVADVEALSLSDKVKRLSVEELPDATDFDLRDAGRRAAGDQVVLKLVMGFGQSKATTVQTQRFVMQRLLVHIETQAGLIFTYPMGGTDPRWLAAPAYSVLLKAGCSQWSAWNRFLRPGLGLNISAPDFDRDGVPELGVALTASIFRDIVQGGFGYNIFAKSWYGFFGIGLPLPTFGGGTGASAERE